MAGQHDREDEERRGAARLGYDAYRGYTWLSRIRRLWALFSAGGAGNTAVTVGAGLLTLGTGAYVVSDFVDSRRREDEMLRLITAVEIQTAKKAVEAVRVGDNAFVYTIVGKDSAGRTGKFDFLVLRKDTTWVKGSASEIMRGAETIPASAFKRQIADGPLVARITANPDLIGAVGVASTEGDQQVEEERAGRRARQIATWLTEIANADQRIWALNLGQYKVQCTSCDASTTDWQRPVAIVGLSEATPGLDVREALTSAVNGTINLPSLDGYTRFTLDRVR